MASESNASRFILRDAATLSFIKRMCAAHPAASLHREALQHLGSDFSYAHDNRDGTWTALIRFSPAIEGKFGFTREMLVLYTKYTDVQPRTLERFASLRSSLPRDRSAEDHVFSLVSLDPTAEAKLDRWTEESALVALTFPRTGKADQVAVSILRSLSRRVVSRNLYDETLPVTGDAFFGRRRLLSELLEEVRQGNVVGVFGLRKTGKTSLVKELGARLQDGGERSRVFVLRDLEGLPTSSPRLGEEFVEDLRESLLAEFRKRELRTKELAELAPSASVGSLRRALNASLIDAEKRAVQVVLALDEIESLVGDAASLSTGSRPEVPEILGALRRLVQERTNFSVVFSGIASALIQRGDLYGVENPIYSWAKVFYIPPMDAREIRELTVQVGARMGLRWSSSALDALHSVSEGNVFLHRTLAAMVADDLSVDDLDRELKRSNVSDVLVEWKSSVAERIAQSYKTTERHYPNECSVLSAFARGELKSDEILAAFGVEGRRLLELHLLERQGSDLRLGVLAQRLFEDGSI